MPAYGTGEPLHKYIRDKTGSISIVWCDRVNCISICWTV